MPQYAYTARDSALKLVEGTVEAESETAAINRLSTRGVYPLSLVLSDEAPTDAAPVPIRRRVPSRTLAYLSRQLADLLGGGLPLFNALKLLAQQTEHRHLQQVVYELSDSVRDGQAFSDAVARQPTVFSPLYISMMKAGETGGGLDAVLNRLADLL